MKSISRRKFLQNGALGLAGCALTSSFIGCQSSSTIRNENLKFLHVTDTHLDLGNEKTITWLNMLIKKINNEFSDIDFVLFGGDNFNNNAPNNSDAIKFKKIVDGLKCPWYSVRGNKEANPKSNREQLNQSDYAKMFFNSNLTILGRDWKLKKGKYTILGLDTTIEQHNNGVFSPETLDFVENELKTNPEQYYILLNHQTYGNFWGSTDKADIHKYVLNNIDEIKKRIFSYPNLKLTLSGHKHLNNVNQFKTVKIISTPGYVVPHNSENDHRFRLIVIKDGNVTQKVVSIV